MKHVKKRSLSFVALVLLLCLSVNIPLAKAHVLKSDNGVSAILHILPDDNPVAGTATDVNLLFNSVGSGFSLNNYKVTIKIVEDGAVKYSGLIKPAYFGAAAEGSTKITFPEAAVYDVIVSGQPTQADIKPFSLDYIVRVSGGTAGLTSQKGNATPIVIIGVVMLVALSMIAVKAISSGGRYHRTTGQA